MRAFLWMLALALAAGTASASQLTEGLPGDETGVQERVRRLPSEDTGAKERDRTSNHDEGTVKERRPPNRDEGGVKERQSQLDLNPIVHSASAIQGAIQGASVEIACAGVREDASFSHHQEAISRDMLLAVSRPIRHRRPRSERGYGYRPPEYFATLGVGAFDPSNQPGSGLYLSGSAGSVLSDQLDLGVQISWYHRSTGGEEFVREGDLPDGTHVKTVIRTQSVTTDLVPVMATLRVRMPVSPGVEPYVGGAIGWEWLTVEGTDQNGFDFSNDYDGFGAQGIAGVNLSVSPQASLYGEGVWNASTPKAEFFDPFVGQTVREEVDFDGLAFHGGLRFRF